MTQRVLVTEGTGGGKDLPLAGVAVGQRLLRAGAADFEGEPVGHDLRLRQLAHLLTEIVQIGVAKLGAQLGREGRVGIYPGLELLIGRRRHPVATPRLPP